MCILIYQQVTNLYFHLPHLLLSLMTLWGLNPSGIQQEHSLAQSGPNYLYPTFMFYNFCNFMTLYTRCTGLITVISHHPSDNLQLINVGFDKMNLTSSTVAPILL